MSKDWPVWEEPIDDELFQLAQITVPYLRFIDKAIIEKIVNDNNENYSKWYDKLSELNITPKFYIWQDTPCVFPGVRRHIGTKETEAFHKRNHDDKKEAIILDDNSYPKKLWSMILRDGKKYDKTNPKGYQLAHIFEHKAEETFSKSKVKLELKGEFTGSIHEFSGLFTSATNTCYIPSALLKPTDNNLNIRRILQEIQIKTYGDFCSVLPPGYDLIIKDDDKWKLTNFNPPKQVGDIGMVADFLKYRNTIVDRYLEKKSNT